VPLAARAQQLPKKMRRLGVLQPGAPPDPLVEAMQVRLRELGYSEGRDVECIKAARTYIPLVRR